MPLSWHTPPHTYQECLGIIRLGLAVSLTPSVPRLEYRQQGEDVIAIMLLWGGPGVHDGQLDGVEWAEGVHRTHQNTALGGRQVCLPEDVVGRLSPLFQRPQSPLAFLLQTGKVSYQTKGGGCMNAT